MCRVRVRRWLGDGMGAYNTVQGFFMLRIACVLHNCTIALCCEDERRDVIASVERKRTENCGCIERTSGGKYRPRRDRIR